jgi:hypothetical protein
MIYWIRKIARLVAAGGFFIIFFCGIDTADPFNSTALTVSFLKAFCGAVIVWFTGFVISDIILKGAVEDLSLDNLEVLDGGLVQRVHQTKKKPQVIDSAEKNGAETVPQAAESKKQNTGTGHPRK